MKIPISNTSAMPIYVGAAMIPPGETRHFDEQDVPLHLRPVPVVVEEPAAPADPLVELLKSNVREVAAALSGLSFADVERLGELEQADMGRKGVLSAVGEELLNRAADTDLMDKVTAMSDEQLSAALADMSTDINAHPDVVAALEAEVAKRKAG